MAAEASPKKRKTVVSRTTPLSTPCVRPLANRNLDLGLDVLRLHEARRVRVLRLGEPAAWRHLAVGRGGVRRRVGMRGRPVRLLHESLRRRRRPTTAGAAVGLQDGGGDAGGATRDASGRHTATVLPVSGWGGPLRYEVPSEGQ